MVIPELPGFSGDVKDENSLKLIMSGQYRTINRGGNSIYELIRKEGFEPYVLCSPTLDHLIQRRPPLVRTTSDSTTYVCTTGSMRL